MQFEVKSAVNGNLFNFVKKPEEQKNVAKTQLNDIKCRTILAENWLVSSVFKSTAISISKRLKSRLELLGNRGRGESISEFEMVSDSDRAISMVADAITIFLQ